MRLPVLSGIIDRRILLNYRVDPEAISRRLPEPFRPLTVGGYGIAGICLIRLARVRPRGWPEGFGFSSENAAHRVAVEWDADGETRNGVYILRRETSSILNVLAGSRVFPGVHRRAAFRVDESGDRFAVDVRGRGVAVSVRARVTGGWPGGSVFPSAEAASAFVRCGSVGYSEGRRAGEFDGMELRVRRWEVHPLAVEQVSSSIFDDPRLFPPGTAAFDDALLMRGIAHEWHGRPRLHAPRRTRITAAR